MRLLLDEQIPVTLAGLLIGHEITTVRSMNWLGLKNGALLRAAAAEGLEALLTLDRGIEFQQNLKQLPIAVLAVRSSSNRLEALEPLIPAIIEALKTLEPRTFVRLSV